MSDQIANIPTNLIMGFLGVGKTTAILDLLKQKPKNEEWAVLVNEFGKVGIDGAIFSAAGATVKELAGGCLCCAVSVPFQVGINRLLKDVKPDRLLIEPTGLGHPKKVLDMLTGDSFKSVLDLRASICLVDPEKLKDNHYTTHENFQDQIALSDVLVANKMDLADSVATDLFHHWARRCQPRKALTAQTHHGQLDVAWLNIVRNQDRQASYPDSHAVTKLYAMADKQAALQNVADGYQSFGYLFSAQHRFDYLRLSHLLSTLNAERIKGVVYTNRGWFIINGVGETINMMASASSDKCRIEIIAMNNQLQDISEALNQCLSDF